MEIYELSVNGINVSHLFDAKGSETFDKDAAKEYAIGCELFPIQKGDVIVVDVSEPV